MFPKSCEAPSSIVGKGPLLSGTLKSDGKGVHGVAGFANINDGIFDMNVHGT